MSHSAEVQVTSRSGLHSRPAANLARLAARVDSAVTLHSDGKAVDAESVLALITAGIDEGQMVTVECVGNNSEIDLAEIVAAIQSGLGD
ncbi:HPr family phosphocarrier protein [Cryobacterium sp. SO2]|uniref:HPr family phosphocarrier protein n=1 Tax=Cryobacterium sp. SO2 TaxID=1897060 RepID=UPI00223E27B8|nr:HPr family phosphocarrier protein [Cryobacterium sp. SO2]WEO78725.1 HPr family phosphocarrier protein [Cryobacterium sp. SO2]